DAAPPRRDLSGREGELTRTALIGPIARQPVCGWGPAARRRARVAGGAVARAVVALFAALDDAVPAAFDLAGRRAAVAAVRVPIVALLAELDDAVAADGLVGKAPE